jgi:hypothetical protein
MFATNSPQMRSSTDYVQRILSAPDTVMDGDHAPSRIAPNSLGLLVPAKPAFLDFVLQAHAINRAGDQGVGC